VMPKQHYWRGMRVPYITAWSAESVRQPPIVRKVGRGGTGIGFADEHPAIDERRHEALWVRSGLALGRGEPVFKRINSHRQRRAMRYDLCQVCGAPANGRDDERTLYLLGADTPITEGETTAAPPVHPLCAIEAIKNCPPLRRAHTAALVEYSPLWGVAGIVHDPVTLTPLLTHSHRLDPLQHVFVGDEMIRWTLASFTVVSLHGVSAVSTDELHAMAADELKTAAGFGPLGVDHPLPGQVGPRHTHRSQAD